MRKTYDTIADPTTGKAVNLATVQVKTYPAGAVASLFSDSGGLAPIANPVLTDANGYFEFYVADGHYSLVITTNSSTRTINDVSIGPTI